MFDSVTGFLSAGLIDPKTPNYAGAAAANERGRQALINQGMQQINAIFNGGSVPNYQIASGSYQPGTQYYQFKPGYSRKNPDSIYKPWNPVKVDNTTGLGQAIGAAGDPLDPGGGAILGGLLGGLFSSSKPDYKAQYPGQLNKGNLYVKGPDQTYQGFGPDFYTQREYDYIHSAMPQLAQQYRDTSNSINYGLANRGLTGSSAGRTAQTKLAQTTGEGEQAIADQAIQQAQGLQSNIEAARQKAIDQLYATTNPSQAAASAISSAAGFQIPQTYQPISNMFSGLMNSYANSQFFNNYAPTQFQNQLPYGYGLGGGGYGGGNPGWASAPVSY